ncbi:hypothetical protein GBAR_LOCUS2486 [Geodia barretti]|uniref:Uncharacterized protein n=1 Tax=Geodia barretti TaxID=519541 RepID=A0AA35QZV7_GEOBA|nr:hypothetical protein GBAR_LOCUS2486 [Geodia barretti]
MRATYTEDATVPERSPRLEGKVAIVTGAGSSGPGVATAEPPPCCSPGRGQGPAGRHHRGTRRRDDGDDPGRGRRGVHRAGGRDQSRRLRAHGGNLHRTLRPAGHPGQQRGHFPARHGGGGVRGRLGPHHGREREDHRHGQQVRHTAHDGGGRRVHHQHLVHRRAARPQQHPVHGVQGSGHRPDHLNGRRSRTRRHPHQLHRPGPGVHPHGRPAYGRRPAPDSQFFGSPPDGGYGVGRSATRRCSWPATRPGGSTAWCFRWTLAS